MNGNQKAISEIDSYAGFNIFRFQYLKKDKYCIITFFSKYEGNTNLLSYIKYNWIYH